LVKILLLAPDIPATSRMPGSPRLFNLSRHLSQKHELLLVTYTSSLERYRAFLNDPATSGVFSRIELLADQPPVGWWGRQWHRLHGAAHFETCYRLPEYYRSTRRRIRELCIGRQIDLMYVDLLTMAQFVDRQLGVPAVIDLHDSMTLMAKRVLKTTRGWRPYLSFYTHLLRMEKLEGTLGRTFDLILTNSAVDEQVICRLSHEMNTLTITNGVDMEYFSPDGTSVDGDKIVFTGVMGYGPNEDAALYFTNEIWPAIKAKRPQAEFWIVGSEPSEKVQSLARMPGVHVTGQVDDVRPYVRSAAVFVSPLRVGSGVKNKVLAAMAMKKPTVATSLSVDGLDLADEREVLLADEPRDFSEKVLRLLTDRHTAQRLGSNGLARVQSHYSWAAMGCALESAIETMMLSRSSHAARRLTSQ
jgi:sugar transferase (PEP-CTERM/EpsH1 system associated)